MGVADNEPEECFYEFRKSSLDAYHIYIKYGKQGEWTYLSDEIKKMKSEYNIPEDIYHTLVGCAFGVEEVKKEFALYLKLCSEISGGKYQLKELINPTIISGSVDEFLVTEMI